MFLMQAEEIRNLWENCVRKGPKDGVKIKVYTPSGLCKKTFPRGGSYQVHDNLASKYSFKITYIMIQMFCYFRKL